MHETDFIWFDNDDGSFDVQCTECGYGWRSQFHDEYFCPYCGYACLENWPKPKRCKDCYYCTLMQVKTLAEKDPRIIKATCNTGEVVDAENSWCAEGVVNEEVFYDLLYSDSES